MKLIPSRRRMLRVSVFVLTGLALAVVFTVAGLLYGITSVARSLPDLRGWHTELPTSEFSADDESPAYTLDDYLQQEAAAFAELDSLIAGPWAAEATGEFNRYAASSVCNPSQTLDRNWNRTFVLDADVPIGGALLVHGLSDSPYSLRTLGLRLQSEGYRVIGLRVPGHGTCPAALAEIEWEDWAAATRIAARSLREDLPDGAPMILAGFSNGGAIVLDYAASALEDEALPRPDAIALFSPMIGISSLAWLTKFHGVIAALSGEEKADWSRISAEIDPFKYSSWPMNASVQAYQMTRRLERRLTELAGRGRMAEFPPVLTLQSAVDSTVNVPALITRLYGRIEHGRNELVLYDVNRASFFEDLLDLSFQNQITAALEQSDASFRLTVITNVAPDSLDVLARIHDGAEVTERPLDLAWPPDVFSLAHGAVPVPPDDPVLGTAEATRAVGLPLGSLNIRGEHGVLMISEGLTMRLRHNPFYAFQEDHVVAWLESARR